MLYSLTPLTCNKQEKVRPKHSDISGPLKGLRFEKKKLLFRGLIVKKILKEDGKKLALFLNAFEIKSNTE